MNVLGLDAISGSGVDSERGPTPNSSVTDA